jgi:hypothetical protein
LEENDEPFERAVILIALLALPGLMGLCMPSRAETGSVAVIFTKGGFIVGVGGARAC